MAVAKKAPAKKTKPTKPANPAKTVKPVKTVKPAQKAASRKGDQYGCKTCGLVLSVVDDCGCGTIDLICCDTPMKKKRAVPIKK